jgi:hypothetical protein
MAKVGSLGKNLKLSQLLINLEGTYDASSPTDKINLSIRPLNDEDLEY